MVSPSDPFLSLLHMSLLKPDDHQIVCIFSWNSSTGAMKNVECRYMRQTLVCIVQFMKAVHITGRFCLFTFRWNFIFTLFSNFRLDWRKYLGNLGSRVSQHKKKCHLIWELLITIDKFFYSFVKYSEIPAYCISRISTQFTQWPLLKNKETERKHYSVTKV